MINGINKKKKAEIHICMQQKNKFHTGGDDDELIAFKSMTFRYSTLNISCCLF